MKRNLLTQTITIQAHRSGVTLSEVLISMLIMGIGVVSLATLFPISVLRSAQATQLTHAVFLRNNAEAAVESNLGLLDNFYPTPQFPVGTTNIALNTNAVMDPLGFQSVGGKLGGIVNRTHGGALSMPAAEQLAGLPDSWTLVFEDIVTGVSGTQITTNTNATTEGVVPRNGQNPGNARYRMVLYDLTGKLAVLRDLYQVISNTGLSWQNVDSSGNALTASPLPTGFTPVRARIEVQQVRYSYLLTVRKKGVPTVNGEGSWVADVDVAVFFNRFYRGTSATPSPGDETPYTLTFPVNSGKGFDGAAGVKGVDDDGDGNIDIVGGVPDPKELGWPGSDDNRTVQVSGSPYLKKGSYMLETSMLKWYRIVDFDKTTGLVLLDQNIRFSASTTVLNGVFLKGIVDVFPLGSRTGQQ